MFDWFCRNLAYLCKSHDNEILWESGLKHWALIEVCNSIGTILSFNPACLMMTMFIATRVEFELLDCNDCIQFNRKHDQNYLAHEFGDHMFRIWTYHLPRETLVTTLVIPLSLNPYSFKLNTATVWPKEKCYNGLTLSARYMAAPW